MKDTGGPAFAASGHPGQQHIQQEGMTLRDYFAAKSMSGICAHNDTWGLTVDEIARHAYEMADAMLKARE